MYWSVVDQWLFMKLTVQEMEVIEGSKKSKKKTAIKQAHRKIVGSLAGKFELTPEQFGENLTDNYSTSTMRPSSTQWSQRRWLRTMSMPHLQSVYMCMCLTQYMYMFLQ